MRRVGSRSGASTTPAVVRDPVGDPAGGRHRVEHPVGRASEPGGRPPPEVERHEPAKRLAIPTLHVYGAVPHHRHGATAARGSDARPLPLSRTLVPPRGESTPPEAIAAAHRPLAPSDQVTSMAAPGSAAMRRRRPVKGMSGAEPPGAP